MPRTEFIAHRINTIAQLRDLPRDYGVEVDLRDRGEKVIMQHDPFADGEDFADYLDQYRHGTMILNIKSERIEHRVAEMLAARGVSRYFFLDCSFPMIVALSRAGERNIALRFSEFEGLDTILAMQGRVGWVWVDCFSRLPIGGETYAALTEAGFKLCLVSPDLVGRAEEIPDYRRQIASEGIVFDAICTKAANIPLWQGG